MWIPPTTEKSFGSGLKLRRFILHPRTGEEQSLCWKDEIIFLGFSSAKCSLSSSFGIHQQCEIENIFRTIILLKEGDMEEVLNNFS